MIMNTINKTPEKDKKTGKWFFKKAGIIGATALLLSGCMKKWDNEIPYMNHGEYKPQIETSSTDLSDLEIISGNFWKDRNHIYTITHMWNIHRKGYIVEWADPETFNDSDEEYWFVKDDTHVFYQDGEIYIKVEWIRDPKSFRIIKKMKWQWWEYYSQYSARDAQGSYVIENWKVIKIRRQQSHKGL